MVAERRHDALGDAIERLRRRIAEMAPGIEATISPHRDGEPSVHVELRRGKLAALLRVPERRLLKGTRDVEARLRAAVARLGLSAGAEESGSSEDFAAEHSGAGFTPRERPGRYRYERTGEERWDSDEIY